MKSKLIILTIAAVLSLAPIPGLMRSPDVHDIGYSAIYWGAIALFGGLINRTIQNGDDYYG